MYYGNFSINSDWFIRFRWGWLYAWKSNDF